MCGGSEGDAIVLGEVMLGRTGCEASLGICCMRRAWDYVALGELGNVGCEMRLENGFEAKLGGYGLR